MQWDPKETHQYKEKSGIKFWKVEDRWRRHKYAGTAQKVESRASTGLRAALLQTKASPEGHTNVLEFYFRTSPSLKRHRATFNYIRNCNSSLRLMQPGHCGQGFRCVGFSPLRFYFYLFVLSCSHKWKINDSGWVEAATKQIQGSAVRLSGIAICHQAN